jgi:hypothetical protein
MSLRSVAIEPQEKGSLIAYKATEGSTAKSHP